MLVPFPVWLTPHHLPRPSPTSDLSNLPCAAADKSALLAEAKEVMAGLSDRESKAKADAYVKVNGCSVLAVAVAVGIAGCTTRAASFGVAAPTVAEGTLLAWAAAA